MAEDLRDLLENFKRGTENYEMTEARFYTLFNAYSDPSTPATTKRAIGLILADRDFLIEKMLAKVLSQSPSLQAEKTVLKILSHNGYDPRYRYWPLIEMKNRVQYYLQTRAGGVQRAVSALETIKIFAPPQNIFTDVMIAALKRSDLPLLQRKALDVIASDVDEKKTQSRYLSPGVFSLLWSLRDHNSYVVRATALRLVDVMLGYLDLRSEQTRQVAREFLSTIVVKIRTLQRAGRSDEAADLVSRLFPEQDTDRFYHYGREERGSVIRTLMRFAEGDHTKLQAEALKELVHLLATGYDVTTHGISHSELSDMLIAAHDDNNAESTEAIKAVLRIYDINIEMLRGHWFAQLCWKLKSKLARVAWAPAQ